MKLPSFSITQHYVKQIGIAVSVVLITGCAPQAMQASRPIYAPAPAQRIYTPPAPRIYTTPAPRIYTPPVPRIYTPAQPRVNNRIYNDRDTTIYRIDDRDTTINKTINNGENYRNPSDYRNPHKKYERWNEKNHKNHDHEDHSHFNQVPPVQPATPPNDHGPYRPPARPVAIERPHNNNGRFNQPTTPPNNSGQYTPHAPPAPIADIQRPIPPQKLKAEGATPHKKAAASNDSYKYDHFNE